MCILAFGWSVMASADGDQSLRDAFAVQSRLYNAESDRYLAARQREDEAAGRYRDVLGDLDRSLADSTIVIDELRRLEVDVAKKRALVIELARESAAVRERLYNRLDSIEQIGALIERGVNPAAARLHVLDGTWRVEVIPGDNFGVIEFNTSGTIVTGSYRMSNGSHGSLRGTMDNARIRLIRIDSENGKDSNLKGVLDPATGEIHGTWLPKELGDGGGGGGEWSAWKLSPGDDGNDILPPE